MKRISAILLGIAVVFSLTLTPAFAQQGKDAKQAQKTAHKSSSKTAKKASAKKASKKSSKSNKNTKKTPPKKG